MSAGQGAADRKTRRVRARVRGRVQGVAYRASTRYEARRLGLSGWVKNLPDGSVELEAQGEPDVVAALLAWCEHGPPAARVSGVEVEELPAVADAPLAFDVRH
jgi:acylphosphatase